MHRRWYITVVDSDEQTIDIFAPLIYAKIKMFSARECCAYVVYLLDALKITNNIEYDRKHFYFILIVRFEWSYLTSIDFGLLLPTTRARLTVVSSTPAFPWVDCIYRTMWNNFSQNTGCVSAALIIVISNKTCHHGVSCDAVVFLGLGNFINETVRGGYFYEKSACV